jgi:3-mercaptopyruvate sulfurtransferase SseA
VVAGRPNARFTEQMDRLPANRSQGHAKGTRGFLIADFSNCLVIPYGQGVDMTYYSRREEENIIPEPEIFGQEWITACKTGSAASCNFDYNGRMMETMLLGLAAYQAGEDVTYDGSTGTTNSARANQFLAKNYREGWPIDGCSKFPDIKISPADRHRVKVRFDGVHL